jgi:hypothetical protein
VIHYIVRCGLSGSTIFFYITTQPAVCGEKIYCTKKYVKSLKFLPGKFLILRISQQKITTTYIDLHVQYRLF